MRKGEVQEKSGLQKSRRKGGGGGEKRLNLRDVERRRA